MKATIELSVGLKFENIICDELVEIIKITEKVCFLKTTSEYCTFEIKKSKTNILNLIESKKWKLI